MSRFRIDQTCPRVVSIMRGDETVMARCHVADRWLARLVGLLGTANLGDDEGLWLAPCSSVHTWGMRIPITCVFLDGQGRVLRVVAALPPWRAVAVPGAAAVLEARAGGLNAVRVGEVLRREPVRGVA